MFSLKLERGKYIRVRGGVDKSDIERVFAFPVNCKTFNGAIISVLPMPRGFCYALPYDTYGKIAKRERVNEERLALLNGNSPLYPTKKVWLP